MTAPMLPPPLPAPPGVPPLAAFVPESPSWRAILAVAVETTKPPPYRDAFESDGSEAM